MKLDTIIQRDGFAHKNDDDVDNEILFSVEEQTFIVEGEGLTSDGYFLIKDMRGFVTVTFTRSTHDSFLDSSGSTIVKYNG